MYGELVFGRTKSNKSNGFIAYMCVCACVCACLTVQRHARFNRNRETLCLKRSVALVLTSPRLAPSLLVRASVPAPIETKSSSHSFTLLLFFLSISLSFATLFSVCACDILVLFLFCLAGCGHNYLSLAHRRFDLMCLTKLTTP